MMATNGFSNVFWTMASSLSEKQGCFFFMPVVEGISAPVLGVLDHAFKEFRNVKAGTDEFERQLNIFKSVCPFSHKFQQSLQKRDPEAFANYEAWKMEKDGPDHCKCRQGTAAKSLTALLQHAEANSAPFDVLKVRDMGGLEEHVVSIRIQKNRHF